MRNFLILGLLSIKLIACGSSSTLSTQEIYNEDGAMNIEGTYQLVIEGRGQETVDVRIDTEMFGEPALVVDICGQSINYVLNYHDITSTDQEYTLIRQFDGQEALSFKTDGASMTLTIDATLEIGSSCKGVGNKI